LTNSVYDEFCDCQFNSTSMAITYSATDCDDCYSGVALSGTLSLKLAKHGTTTAVATVSQPSNGANPITFALTSAMTTGLLGRYDYQITNTDGAGNTVVLDCGCINFNQVIV
jgi:hypothetical protein